MNIRGVIRRQLVDFLVYLALPLVSVILPAAWSRSLLARSSNFNWVLSTEAEAAWSSAGKYVDSGDEKVWKARWKQVEMLDARDCYMMSFGRTRAVLAEVECDIDLELVRDKALIGMHWGPAISILKMLQVAGLDPALPYRQPEKDIFRIRPFFYLFVSLATRHIVKTLGDRAVQIGGKYAQLDKKVVLVGQRHRFELWSEENWNSGRESWLADSEGDLQIPVEMQSLSL